MAIRAKKAKILWPVVKDVSVDVIHLQPQRHAVPYRAYPATVALFRPADRQQGPHQPVARRANRTSGQDHKSFLWRHAIPAGHATVVHLPREVTGVDLEGA